jgi:hypothetical protein
LQALDEPPARPVSQKIDLADDPELRAALAEVEATHVADEAAVASEPELADAPHEDGAVEPEPAPAEAEYAEPPPQAAAPAPVLAIELPDFSSLLPEPERPRTAEEQHQLRISRTVLRLQTARDAFRVIGQMAATEAERKAVARMLMDIDPALARKEGEESAVKNPEAALAGAAKEQLDLVERMLAPIEDRLLALDEQVPRETFENHIASSKYTKKVIARYGRLLASRKFQADERRNRFEWVATHLLSVRDDQGLRHALPPERARPVLQQLVGGLPSKVKEHERAEATQYLREAYARLQQLVTAEEFFESGFYVDVHGYKVTMRDLLHVPEFVYLSALLNVALDNRLEAWISDLERLHSTNQVRQDASAREQIMRALRTEEEAVESALGVKRKTGKAAVRPETANINVRSEAEEPQKPAAKKKAEPTRKRFSSSFEVVWDRNMILAVVSLVVILGVGGFLAVSTGAVGREKIQALEDAQLHEISPLLARGWIKGDGDDRRLAASLQRRAWDALEPRRRTEAAEGIAKTLAERGIKHADLKIGDATVISIVDAYVARVEGGKI